MSSSLVKRRNEGVLQFFITYSFISYGKHQQRERKIPKNLPGKTEYLPPCLPSASHQLPVCALPGCPQLRFSIATPFNSIMECAVTCRSVPF